MASSATNLKPGHIARRTGFLNSSKGGGTPLHRYRKGKKPKKPVKTAQEEALERRQTQALDDEIEESEERFAALRRGNLGRVSLLSGAPKNAAEASSGKRSGGASGVGSMLSGVSGGGGSGRSTSNRSILTLANRSAK